MRFFEFAGDDAAEKIVIILRNYIGRASSKKSPAKLNWNGLNRVLTTSGVEITADYETFKAMYDASTTLQSMIKNFDDSGIELNVPGASDPSTGSNKPDGTQDSQAAVDKIAASAAPQQLASQT